MTSLSDIGFTSRRVCVHERLPGERNLGGQVEAVLGDAGGRADRAEDALAAVRPDGRGDGAVALEAAAFLLAHAEALGREEHRVHPLAEEAGYRVRGIRGSRPADGSTYSGRFCFLRGILPRG